MRNLSRAGLASAMFLAAASMAAAQEPCPLTASDITSHIAAAYQTQDMLVTTGIHPDSAEPIRRTIVALDGGDMLIVEQRHCDIHNLTVTLMDSSRLSAQDTLALMLKAVAVTPTWSEHFSQTPQEAFRGVTLQEGGMALDDRIRPAKSSAEIYLSRDTESLADSGFQAVTSLSVSVGGH